MLQKMKVILIYVTKAWINSKWDENGFVSTHPAIFL